MSSLARNMAVWLVLVAGVMSLGAASSAEKKAFSEAQRSFQGTFWERAERELGEFIQRYPDSEFMPRAVLLQAEARINKPNPDYDGAIDLLKSRRAASGSLADEYLFWLAEAYLQKGEPAVAADFFAEVVKDNPSAPRVLEAVVAEAESRSQLDQWSRVVELLQSPDGHFQRLALANPAQPAATRGYLLLAEAQLGRGHLPEAEAALAPLANAKLAPTLMWRRASLLARAQLAAGRAQEARTTAASLTSIATNQPVLMAEGHALQARILEQLNLPDDAIAAWQQNLAVPAPFERQREASLRVAELLLAQERVGDALQTLEGFLTTVTNAPAMDEVWLAVGELRLRKFAASAAGAGTNAATATATNLLPQALEAFQTLITQFPQSPLMGKARLGLGWAFWLDGRMDESGGAFEAAARTLPSSYDQAVARFKLGDVLFCRRDHAGAVTNYQAVVASGNALPEVQSNLVERALFQLLQAALQAEDTGAANGAMAQLLEVFPEGTLAEPGLLAFGGGPAGAGNPAARREVFAAFLSKAPDSKLAPAVRLAAARAYEQARDWKKASDEYAAWLAAYPGHPARARAEYFQALATARAENEPGALNLFTNFVAQFPTNEFTPLAQWWVADHYWRAGDFVKADLGFQKLFKAHPESALRYEAQLMAGRANMAGQRPEQALMYFTNLTSDIKCPPRIYAQALFATGDAFMAMSPAETNQLRANYAEAAKRFIKVAQSQDPNLADLAVLAQGKLADCYWQLCGADPAQYKLASDAYLVVVTNRQASVAARSQAEVGLGLVVEKASQLGTNQAELVQQSLDHFLNVVYGRNLNVSEQGDPFWVTKAGLEALRVSESLQAWGAVTNLCTTLAQALPPLQPMLEKKRARAEERAARRETN